MFDRLSDVFISRPIRSSNKKRGKCRLEIQDLESRQVMAADMMATLTTTDGILRIEGTDADDNITVFHDQGQIRVEGVNIRVTAGSGDSSATAVGRSQVQHIIVVALGGNDTVSTVETLLTGEQPVVMGILGGGGRDVLRAGLGSSIIYGGPGNDTISAGLSSSWLYGGGVADGTSVGSSAMLLDRQYQFFSDGNDWLNYLGKGERWLKGGATGQWHYITPTGDLYQSNGTKIAKLDSTFHQDLSGLYDAYSGPRAGNLDRDLGLYTTGDLHQNWGGRNEKWLMSQSTGVWHYITPDGGVYRWDGSAAASGALQAQLDVSYWVDVNKLVQASEFQWTDDDVISGSFGNDSLYGGAGNDILQGLEGNDWLQGDAGMDTLRGGAHNDVLNGGEQADTLVGGDGNDTLRGGGGDDQLWGGAENKPNVGRVIYTNDSDNLYGDADNDVLYGGAGLVDYLFGGIGDDVLWGEEGNDYLYGDENNDTLYGGAGLDSLFGGAGNDGLFGGWGDGQDSLTGGAGADRFLQSRYDIKLTPIEEDKIQDLAYEDANVLFARGDKNWTDKEVIAADEGLAWLHKTTNNTSLLKTPGSDKPMSLSRFGYLEHDGMAAAGINSSGKIWIADNGTNGEVVVHEIAHNWDQQFDSIFFAQLSGWEVWNLTTNPTIKSNYLQAARFGEKQSWVSGGQKYCWIYRADAQFSDTYGRTNPREDFATCLEKYYALTKGTDAGAATGTRPATNPAANWQAKWNYINDWLARKRT